jgi:hypothetical protein
VSKTKGKKGWREGGLEKRGRRRRRRKKRGKGRRKETKRECPKSHLREAGN